MMGKVKNVGEKISQSQVKEVRYKKETEIVNICRYVPSTLQKLRRYVSLEIMYVVANIVASSALGTLPALPDISIGETIKEKLARVGW
jgi:hypothetical protein